MANKQRNGIINSRGITPESENRCYINVRHTHRRVLRRRDLTSAIIARFTPKYVSADGCWLWTAGKFAGGYGQFHLWRELSGKIVNDYAHRVAYVLHTGEDIPVGAVVMHSCDVPACVNPAHLTLGTQADNVHDAVRKGHYSVPHTPGARTLKLTDADVADIRSSPEKSVRLAERYRVSLTAISLIRRGLRRKVA
jgi:hypothetical protein